MRTLRVGLAQINTTVGDLDGNVARILEYAASAWELGCDLVAFPELAVTGYPPEDLLLRRSFIADNLSALQRIVEGSSVLSLSKDAARKDEAPRQARGDVSSAPVLVVGFVDEDGDIYNAAAVIHDGRPARRGGLAGVYHKWFLPNYGVFDENRYFQAGTQAPVFEIGGVRVGVNVCEDIWYPDGPSRAQAQAGAEVIVNINGSPYHAGKRRFREEMLATRASDDAVIVCYVNLVGGQDELVFDGGSMVFDERGELIARAAQFEEELLVVDLDIEGVHQTRLHDPRRRKERLEFARTGGRCPRIVVSSAQTGGRPPEPAAASQRHPELVEGRPSASSGQGPAASSGQGPSASSRQGPSTSSGQHPELVEGRIAEPLSPEAEVYAALVLGTRDYVRKVGYETVLVGLSGGVDSSLVAAVAVDALGAEHVVGVAMPSRYSSEGSLADAQRVAEHLGIQLQIVPIEPAHAAYHEMLELPFEGTEPGTAEENVQARIRGNVLMALSNKFGWLVLTTGNKSEYATGYCTLYGDMAGGFAVLKDVPKTLVYRLAEHRNRVAASASGGGRELIPRSVIEKPPSAELRPDQRDTDTLPPYDQLDPILQAYVEDDRSLEELVAMGHDEALVRRVMAMVDRNEYKRRQAPPGVKITPRAFGRDRRLPIANHYRGY